MIHTDDSDLGGHNCGQGSANVPAPTNGTPKRRGLLSRYIILLMIVCGAGALVLGGAMGRIPGMERVGVVVGSIGLLVASAGVLLRRKPPVGIEQAGSKLLRKFLWLTVYMFVALILWGVMAGTWNLYDCSRFSGRSGTSIAEILHQSLSRDSNILQQHPGIARAQDRCLFGFLELAVAAACTCSLIAVLRALKIRRSD
jgi:hypothetical protein